MGGRRIAEKGSKDHGSTENRKAEVGKCLILDAMLSLVFLYDVKGRFLCSNLFRDCEEAAEPTGDGDSWPKPVCRFNKQSYSLASHAWIISPTDFCTLNNLFCLCLVIFRAVFFTRNTTARMFCANPLQVAV